MPKANILVVDDDSKILKLVEHTLATEGYQILTARTSAQALLQIKNFLPRLIIMDIVLPDSNGAEAYQAIKAECKTPHIPVIFLTGIITKKEESIPVMAGAQQFPIIAKPFHPDELIRRVKEALLIKEN